MSLALIFLNFAHLPRRGFSSLGFHWPFQSQSLFPLHSAIIISSHILLFVYFSSPPVHDLNALRYFLASLMFLISAFPLPLESLNMIFKFNIHFALVFILFTWFVTSSMSPLFFLWLLVSSNTTKYPPPPPKQYFQEVLLSSLLQVHCLSWSPLFWPTPPHHHSVYHYVSRSSPTLWV